MKADDDYEHQRFSQATFIGVNFPLLEGYFEQRDQGGMLSRPELQGPSTSGSCRESMAPDHVPGEENVERACA